MFGQRYSLWSARISFFHFAFFVISYFCSRLSRLCPIVLTGVDLSIIGMDSEKLLPNVSIVNEDMVQGNTALQCRTNATFIDPNDQDIGKWMSPDGSSISTSSSGLVYVLRFPGVVILFLNGKLPPSLHGVYTCQIVNSDMNNSTLYAGIYSAEDYNDGEENSLHTPPRNDNSYTYAHAQWHFQLFLWMPFQVVEIVLLKFLLSSLDLCGAHCCKVAAGIAVCEIRKKCRSPEVATKHKIRLPTNFSGRHSLLHGTEKLSQQIDLFR